MSEKNNESIFFFKKKKQFQQFTPLETKRNSISKKFNDHRAQHLKYFQNDCTSKHLELSLNDEKKQQKKKKKNHFTNWFQWLVMLYIAVMISNIIRLDAVCVFNRIVFVVVAVAIALLNQLTESNRIKTWIAQKIAVSDIENAKCQQLKYKKRGANS